MTVLNTGIQFSISVGGIPMIGEGPAALESVEVSTSLVRPSSAIITFSDPARVIMQGLRLSLGDAIEIAATVDTEFTAIPLIDGDVVGLESVIGSGGSQTIVIVHDPLHRLQRSVESHTYREMPIADIVREVADRHGLATGDIDDRGFPTRAVTNQFYETDFDFLSHLAGEVGVSLYWRDGELRFASPSPASDGPSTGLLSGGDPRLVVREADLIRGHVSLSTVGATADTASVGWDMMANEALSSGSSVTSNLVDAGESASDIAGVEFGGGLLGLLGGSSESVSAGRTFSTNQEALEHAALVHAERLGHRTAELELIVEGRPQLQAGEAITVAGLEDPFDGSYAITEATHRYGPHLGYTTQLQITGLEDRSLGSFTSRAPVSNHLMTGVVPAVVSANRDEDAGAYRVKVLFPWLGDDIETDWLQVCAPGAGAGRGISFLPEVGDSVLIAFQAGDPRQPIVVGAAYNGQDQPPTDLDDQVAGNGEVIRRSIVSRLGHKIVFVDAEGEESIEVITADGKCHVILDQSGSKVEIVSAGDLALESTGNLSIEAGGDLTMSARGNAELSSQGNATLAAQGNAEVSASAMTKIKGTRIDLN